MLLSGFLAKSEKRTAKSKSNGVSTNSILEILTMRYMLLIYSNERAETQANPAEMQAIMQGHQAVMEGTMKAGILRAADPLHPTSTATTIRVQNGKSDRHRWPLRGNQGTAGRLLYPRLQGPG